MTNIFSCARILTGIFVLLAAVPSLSGTMPESVSYRKRQTAHAWVHVITANMNDPHLQLSPALSYGMPGRRQSFKSFLRARKPYAQITGTYFDMQRGYPIGDIVIDHQVRFDGSVGSALAVRPDNTVEIVDVPRWEAGNWGGYQHVVQGGMRLLKNGRNALSPWRQGFGDPSLFRRASRTGIGVTKRNKVLMVAVTKGVYLSQLRDIMKSLGCRDAMTMDGGTSTGLAVGGRIIVHPGRTLSNVVIVTRRKIPAEKPAAPQTAQTIPAAPQEVSAVGDTAPPSTPTAQQQ